MGKCAILANGKITAEGVFIMKFNYLSSKVTTNQIQRTGLSFVAKLQQDRSG